MALGDKYVSVTDFKAHAEIGDTDDDTEIGNVLDAVSRSIERFCGRQFNDAGSASARVYWPHRPDVIRVDDFHTTTGLVVAYDSGNDGSYGSTVTSSNYTLYPLNGVVDGITGHPWRQIQLHNTTLPSTDRPTMQVTAQWGWAAVPHPVEAACLIQATRIYRRKHNPGGLSLGTNDFVFRTPAKLDGDVEAMLRPYVVAVPVA